MHSHVHKECTAMALLGHNVVWKVPFRLLHLKLLRFYGMYFLTCHELALLEIDIKQKHNTNCILNTYENGI